jgi:hypothetical protein
LTRPSLDPDAEALVRNWYRKDYEFLDLCAEWREQQDGAVAKAVP